MTDMFLEKFRALVPKYLEDEWQDEDGLVADELDSALAEHQFQVPLVLREFYLAVGGCEDIMEAYHYFWDPEELEVDDEGFLMFLEDEEEQFTWGFRIGDLSIPDPIVYRRNNARAPVEKRRRNLLRIRLRHVRVGVQRRGLVSSPCGLVPDLVSRPKRGTLTKNTPRIGPEPAITLRKVPHDGGCHNCAARTGPGKHDGGNHRASKAPRRRSSSTASTSATIRAG
jgi:hypothetical protein